MFFLCLAPCVRARDLEVLRMDRAAIERVYHEHRTGTKEPFEEVMPRALLEKLVREDVKKEAVLARAYGVKITDAMLVAEVQRINATTRAPEMLAGIKSALGNDAGKFAESFARPFVVERLLRERFENDDALHAPQRRATEAVRATLLAAKGDRLAVMKDCKAGDVQEQVTWLLTPRPVEAKDEGAVPNAPANAPVKGAASSASYSVEAMVQIAQVLSAPENPRDEKDRTLHFGDLPGELQTVLRTQLRAAGDVSAVIEGPRAFQLFLTRERTAEALTVATLTIPKRSYEEWLALQPD